jgi:hypothetical protein
MKWDNGAPMGDMSEPEQVEVLIDKHNPNALRLWINVDGQCRLRIYNIDPTTFSVQTFVPRDASMHNVSDRTEE